MTGVFLAVSFSLAGLCFPAGPADASNPAPPVLPSLSLEDLSGIPVDVSRLEGHSLLVLNFLAPWCAPCLREIPSLTRLVRLSGGRIEVVGVVEGRESLKQVRRFGEKNHARFRMLLDPEMKLSDALHVVRLPTSFIVDSKGRIVSQVSGAVNWTDPGVITYLRSLNSPKAGF